MNLHMHDCANNIRLAVDRSFLPVQHLVWLASARLPWYSSWPQSNGLQNNNFPSYGSHSIACHLSLWPSNVEIYSTHRRFFLCAKLCASMLGMADGAPVPVLDCKLYFSVHSLKISWQIHWHLSATSMHKYNILFVHHAGGFHHWRMEGKNSKQQH